MQHTLRNVSSILAALVVVAGTGSWLGAETTGGSNARTRTGTLTQCSAKSLTLESGKRGNVTLSVDQGTRVFLDQAVGINALMPERLVKIRGKGKAAEITAREILVLPVEETLRVSKTARTGNAFGNQAKGVTLKARIVKAAPLTVVNRYGQAIVIRLGDKTEVLRRDAAEFSALREGMKVRATYRETGDQRLATEIVAEPERTVTKAEKK